MLSRSLVSAVLSITVLFFLWRFSGPVRHGETLAERAELLVKVLGVSGAALSLATSRPDLADWLAGRVGLLFCCFLKTQRYNLTQ